MSDSSGHTVAHVRTAVVPPDDQGAPSFSDADGQLADRRDRRWQRWILYAVLLALIIWSVATFLCIIKTAWDDRTEASILAFAQISPSAAALLGAIIAALVALPLSLSLALSRMLSDQGRNESNAGGGLTTALFELGKAFAEGVDFIRNKKSNGD